MSQIDDLAVTVKKLAEVLDQASAEIIETKHCLYALVAALGNQKQVDPSRLSQDFITSLRLVGIDPSGPSKGVKALLTQLQAAQAGSVNSPGLALAERLLRSGVLAPEPTGPDGAA